MSVQMDKKFFSFVQAKENKKLRKRKKKKMKSIGSSLVLLHSNKYNVPLNASAIRKI